MSGNHFQVVTAAAGSWRRLNHAGDQEARPHMIATDETGVNYLDMRRAKAPGLLALLGVLGYVTVDGKEVLALRFDADCSVSELESTVGEFLNKDAEDAEDRAEGITLIE